MSTWVDASVSTRTPAWTPGARFPPRSLDVDLQPKRILAPGDYQNFLHRKEAALETEERAEALPSVFDKRLADEEARLA